MGMRYKHGFTIIEVVLFLAISGLLAIGLLGGWTTMIDTQRYKDSVKTLQSFIQQQYNLVYNVQNGRLATMGCAANAAGPSFSEDTPATANKPGQSSCVVMGRYIHVRHDSGDSATKITVYPIIGNDDDNSDERHRGDTWLIAERKPLRISDDIGLSESSLTIPWGATVVGPGTDIETNYAIVIVRSPETGAVHTYSQVIGESMPDALSLIGAGANNDTNLCLNPNTGLVNYRLGVVIRAGASTQSSVQILTDSGGIC